MFLDHASTWRGWTHDSSRLDDQYADGISEQFQPGLRHSELSALLRILWRFRLIIIIRWLSMTTAQASVLLIVPLITLLTTGCAPEPSDSNRQKAGPAQNSSVPLPRAEGERLFKQFCASCHPDGGNVSDPERTLHASALNSRHISSTAGIVNIMRNPGPRMLRFDTETVPDREAQAIADYILTTFR